MFASNKKSLDMQRKNMTHNEEKKNQCMKTGPELIQMSEITDNGIKNSYHSYSLIIKKK